MPTYSEDFQEVLGQPPALIIRSGMGAIFVLLVILLVLSAFIRYPKTVTARVELTSQNPPVDIVARSTGKIQTIFAQKYQTVQAGDYLAILENSADFQAIQAVKKWATDFKPDSKADFILPKLGNLGSLESSFQQFVRQIQAYQNHKIFDLQGAQITALEEQIAYYAELNLNLKKQNQFIHEDAQLTRNQYVADSILYHKAEGISKRDLEKSKSLWINKQQTFLQNESAIINNQLTIKNLDQQITELQLKKQESAQVFREAIQKSQAELLAQIKNWEQTYVLLSPISGKIDFHAIRTQNQEVKTGDVVFSMIPQDKKWYCKAQIPASDIGEVRQHQWAWVEFDAFHAGEYGRIKAQLTSISLIPQDEHYTATFELVDGLKTNYQKVLPFKISMQGSAEIMTENLTVLERIFYQFRSWNH